MSDEDDVMTDADDVNAALGQMAEHRSEIENITGRMAARDLKIGQLTFSLEYSRAAAAKIRHNNERLYDELAYVTARLNAVQNDVARLTDENREARRQRDEILSSTSWRLTGPIRFLATRLGRRGG